MSTARVASIAVTPVKGLGLSSRPRIYLDRVGARENRRFYLLDEEGRLVNGKRLGQLVRATADWDEAADTLAVHLPGGGTVEGEVELGEAVTTDFYGRPVDARIVVGPWAEAFAEWAGLSLRLARPNEPGQAVDRGHRGAMSIASTASLEALAEAARVAAPVDSRRFRMLFGVEGVAPHEEDTWLGRRVRIGEAVVLPTGLVGRCAVTTQNPETGVPDLDTLRVLREYRGQVPTVEPLPFGVYGEVVEPGVVAVGDPVGPV